MVSLILTISWLTPLFGVNSALGQEVGTIITVAGNGAGGYSGDNGLATNASIDLPVGLTVDEAGHLYIADQFNHRVRRVGANGTIITVAGTGNQGFSGDDGSAIDAVLYNPFGLALDGAGNLYIADKWNNRIRKVDTNGFITTVAGNGTAGFSGDGGQATEAQLNEPQDVTVDGAGNLYIADTNNHRIRKVDINGHISTVAGNGIGGYSGDLGPATDYQLYWPQGVAVDEDGNLYIADTWNHRIRKVDSFGLIETVAGTWWGYLGDGGPATEAQLHYPEDVAVDRAGNLYIADTSNNCIRKVDTNGTISTVAGNGTKGFSGDGGPSTTAQLNYPRGVVVDGAGNIYIADTKNYRVRAVILDYHAPLGIETTTLPGAILGEDYSVRLAARGGTEPYSWSIVNGILPNGLSLDSMTGFISGQSTVSGNFSLTLSVADSANPNASASETLTLKVSAKEDFNEDGNLDLVDLSILAGTYGSNDTKYDLNGDGEIDIYDLVILGKKMK